MGNSRILILSIVLALIAPGHKLAAQSYAGGSFSVSTAFTSANGKMSNSNSLTISPEIGWYLDERTALGLRPTVGFSNWSSGDRALALGVTPYLRYRFLAFNKFGLWAEGQLNFIYNRSQAAQSQTGRSFDYGLGLRPILTYDLSDHICLYGAVNLFSLSIRGISTFYEERGQWQHSFYFGLAGQTDDVIDSLTNISIGFLYRF